MSRVNQIFDYKLKNSKSNRRALFFMGNLLIRLIIIRFPIIIFYRLIRWKGPAPLFVTYYKFTKNLLD
jgi:hypothetical protein